MKVKAVSLFTLALLSLSGPASADGEMKTGLWEMSLTLSAEQMAAMPKDHQVPGLVGNVMRQQVCITPREAEGLGMLDDRDGGSCKLVNKVVNGSTVTADAVCSDAASQGGGKRTAVIKDSGNISWVAEISVTLPDKKVVLRQESAGRWLNAACGGVK